METGPARELAERFLPEPLGKVLAAVLLPFGVIWGILPSQSVQVFADWLTGVLQTHPESVLIAALAGLLCLIVLGLSLIESKRRLAKKYVRQYSRGGLIWKVWTTGQDDYRTQAFCFCGRAVRSSPTKGTYCLKCPRKYMNHADYKELFAEVQVLAQGDWRVDRGGYHLEKG